MKYNTSIFLCLMELATLSISAVPTAITEHASRQASPSSLPQTKDITPSIPLSLDEVPSKHNLTQHKGGGGRGGGGFGKGGGSGGKGGSSGKGGGSGSSSGNDAAAGGAAVGGAAGGKGGGGGGGGGHGSGSTNMVSSLDMRLLCTMLLGGVMLSLFLGV
ncbi:hypothetical protein DL98DRAFT_590985 [Cadophora sp. DSE1049]|nr:hypothetical protein DL98DRAFT_590985 [Cadophora sp. DSE1049]